MSLVKPIFENGGVKQLIDNSNWSVDRFLKDLGVFIAGYYEVTVHNYADVNSDAFSFGTSPGNSSPAKIVSIPKANSFIGAFSKSVRFYADGSTNFYVQISGGTINAASNDYASYSIVKIA